MSSCSGNQAVTSEASSLQLSLRDSQSNAVTTPSEREISSFLPQARASDNLAAAETYSSSLTIPRNSTGPNFDPSCGFCANEADCKISMYVYQQP